MFSSFLRLISIHIRFLDFTLCPSAVLVLTGTNTVIIHVRQIDILHSVDASAGVTLIYSKWQSKKVSPGVWNHILQTTEERPGQYHAGPCSGIGAHILDHFNIITCLICMQLTNNIAGSNAIFNQHHNSDYVSVIKDTVPYEA